jgi:hypothetical protein
VSSSTLSPEVPTDPGVYLDRDGDLWAVRLDGTAVLMTDVHEPEELRGNEWTGVLIPDEVDLAYPRQATYAAANFGPLRLLVPMP